MQKLLASLLTAALFMSASWSQEEESATAPVSDEQAVDTDVAVNEADPEILLEGDLDDQNYEEDDDEFVPTEEIPADEPIPFPSNI